MINTLIDLFFPVWSFERSSMLGTPEENRAAGSLKLLLDFGSDLLGRYLIVKTQLLQHLRAASNTH